MNLKSVIGIVLIALVLVFTVQNLEIVQVRFLLWDVNMPRALMIFVVFLLGVSTGWLLRTVNRRR